MEKVSCGEVTYAVREGSLNGVSFQSGEVIGLLNEELVSAGQEIGGVCLDLIEKMLERFPQASVLTIYRGEEVLEDDAQEVVDQILEKHPGLEVDLLYGGQPYYYYVISLE